MLRVRDLRVSFRTEHGLMKAIDGVSFDVSEGEILGVEIRPPNSRHSLPRNSHIASLLLLSPVDVAGWAP